MLLLYQDCVAISLVGDLETSDVGSDELLDLLRIVHVEYFPDVSLDLRYLSVIFENIPELRVSRDHVRIEHSEIASRRFFHDAPLPNG